MSSAEPAAVLHGPRDVRLQSHPIDEPGEGELLIEVSAVGICGSDVHYFEHGALGPNVVRGPHILGHEFSGRVVGAGRSAAGNPAMGRRVTVEPGAPCGDCAQCRSGRYNLCARVRFLGAPPHDGALRGHVAVDAALVYGLPDSVSDAAGALIEPLAVALWACRRGRVSGGERVLVTGAGPVGLLTAQVARALGASEVTIVDLNPHRLALASRLGIDRALHPDELRARADRLSADVLIECSGSAPALTSGVTAVRPAGTVVVVGMAAEGSVTFSLDHLQRRELTVVGSFRYAGCYPDAIALAQSGHVELEALITSRHSLADATAALTVARRDPAAVKALVLPGQAAA